MYLPIALPSIWTWAKMQFLAFVCALSDGVIKCGNTCEAFSLGAWHIVSAQ